MVKYNVKIAPLPCKINLSSEAAHCFTSFIHPEQIYFPTLFPQKGHFSALMTYSVFILILRFASCLLFAAAALLFLIFFFESRNISRLENFLADILLFLLSLRFYWLCFPSLLSFFPFPSQCLTYKSIQTPETEILVLERGYFNTCFWVSSARKWKEALNLWVYNNNQTLGNEVKYLTLTLEIN